MAGIVVRAAARVKSQLTHLLPADQVEARAEAVGHTWRRRVLGPAQTVHLFLLQLLAGVAMSALRHASGVAVSAQAVCKAKARLPLTLMMDLVEWSATPAATPAASSPAGELWRGLRVLVADATSFLTPDTEALDDAYGKGGNAKGKSKGGYPVPKLLAALDLATGLLRKVIAMPADRQERTCLGRLLRAAVSSAGVGAVMLADRGLAGFAQLALAAASEADAVVRLPRWLVTHGRGTPTRRRVRRLGKQDLLVEWRRDGGGVARHALRRPGWMSKVRWAELPATLTLRQVAFRLTRPGFRTHWAWVVTTLLDPARYPAEELVKLYGRRWQVEVCFRDLKRTLGMGRRPLRATDVQGVRKEVLAFVLLYNLVRRVCVEAAARQGVAPDRVSFADAAAWLLWSEPGSALTDLKLNPLREGRPSQPRLVKRARKRYGQLNERRQALQKPPGEAKL